MLDGAFARTCADSTSAFRPTGVRALFSADLMFYRSAQEAMRKAAVAQRRIDRAEQALAKHHWKYAAANEYADDDDRDPDKRRQPFEVIESLAIQFENYEYAVVEAHGP